MSRGSFRAGEGGLQRDGAAASVLPGAPGVAVRGVVAVQAGGVAPQVFQAVGGVDCQEIFRFRARTRASDGQPGSVIAQAEPGGRGAQGTAQGGLEGGVRRKVHHPCAAPTVEHGQKVARGQEAERAVRLWEHLWVGRALRRGKELLGGNRGERGCIQQGEKNPQPPGIPLPSRALAMEPPAQRANRTPSPVLTQSA